MPNDRHPAPCEASHHLDLTPHIPREHFLRLTGAAAAGAAAAALGARPALAASVGTIRFGYQPSTHQVAFIVAQEKGWWLDNLRPSGVTDIKANLFPSGPPEMSAMLGGDLDVAYVGWAPPISAIARGLDAKVVCSVQWVGSVLCIRPRHPVEARERAAAMPRCSPAKSSACCRRARRITRSSTTF